jgi:hypothetical protein
MASVCHTRGMQPTLQLLRNRAALLRAQRHELIRAAILSQKPVYVPRDRLRTNQSKWLAIPTVAKSHIGGPAGFPEDSKAISVPSLSPNIES